MGLQKEAEEQRRGAERKVSLKFKKIKEIERKNKDKIDQEILDR